MCPCWFAVFIWNGFNLGRLESCSLNHQNQYKHHKLLEFALGESISCTKLTEKTWIGRQTSSCLHVSSHVMTFEAYSECVWTDTSDMAWYDLKWMTWSEMASHMTCQCLPLLALHNPHPSFQIVQAEPRLNSSLSKEAEAAQASSVCTSASWSCVNGINEWREGRLARTVCPRLWTSNQGPSYQRGDRFHALWWSCSCYMYSHYPCDESMILQEHWRMHAISTQVKPNWL